jgi:hypothetical protein
MGRSREVEQKARVKQALRALRKVWRGLDTQGERMERNLDRLINRTTLVYADQLEPMIGEWRDFKSKVNLLEKAMTDTLTIASY